MVFLDERQTYENLAKFSRRDAERWQDYWAMWNRMITRFRPLILGPAPTLTDLEKAFSGPEGSNDLKTLLFRSIAEVLDEFFESEEIKAPLCTGGVIGVNLGPRSPGSAYVKFHHLLGNLNGQQGAWGFVRGGMGSIAEALAAYCRDHGVTILTDAEVAEIEVHDGAARAVRLTNDRRFTAAVILSNADPQRTFLQLVPSQHLPASFREAIARLKVKGSVVKVLLGLNELPNFRCLPGTDIGPQHTGGIVINPSIDYLEQAWQDCKQGRPSAHPFMDCYIQSATEDGLAPPGKHVMSLYVQYAPYDLAEGTWEQRKEEIGRNIVNTFAEYAPNIWDAIEYMAVLGPRDIEEVIGITGGNIFHGEITPDQMFCFRPAPGFAGYKSPIERLYLCGSGAWPGGAVFGAPGRNCALQVLADLERWGL